ncbi:MAG: zinc-dependent alcohol dehydrogenase family protein [Pseudobdellovibrionaceae bacterium]
MVMNSMMLSGFGGPEVFELKQIPLPQVKKGHVLVRVRATSVNPLDTKLRNGVIPALSPAFPAILHGDFAGEVVEVGSEVTDLKVGDRVFGCGGGIVGFQGALAQYMLVDRRLMAPLSDEISFEEGAAAALVGLTAWESVFDKVDINPEDKVLVLGGTGGVAQMAIQLARLRTANVFSTTSSEAKVEIVKKLGAKKVFNYRSENFIQEALAETPDNEGFDIVIDTIGAQSLDSSFQLAKRYGHVITCQAANTHNLSLLHLRGLSLHVVFMLLPMLTGKKRDHHQNILENLSHLMQKGSIRPLIHERIFSLEDVGKAHAELESGRAIGKVVIRVP